MKPKNSLTLLLTLIFGCSSGTQTTPTAPPPATNVSDSTATTTATRGQTSSQTDTPSTQLDAVSVSPSELEKSGFSQYQNKTIETTGVILELSILDDFGKQSIALKTDKEFGFLNCKLKTADPDLYGKLAPGQTVTLRGAEVDDGVFTNWLWTVASSGPNPGIIVPATDLAREFSADKEATEKKYGDRSLYVVGKVSKIEVEDGDKPMLTLKGVDGVSLLCDFSQQVKETEKIKVGDSVQVLATYLTALSEGERIWLAHCRLVTKPLPFPGVTYAKPSDPAAN